ncbi:MAG: hypothetical protein QXU18_09480 [Thermoplasmatales archaeon]
MAQRIASGLMDRVFRNKEMMFEEKRGTNGKEAKSLVGITPAEVGGLLNSIFNIERISIGRYRNRS